MSDNRHTFFKIKGQVFSIETSCWPWMLVLMPVLTLLPNLITCFSHGCTDSIYSWLVLVLPRSHKLVKMCKYISACMHVYLSHHICSTSFQSCVQRCVAPHVCPSYPLLCPTPWFKYVHAFVHVYIYT